jgi:hypothetical protein
MDDVRPLAFYEGQFAENFKGAEEISVNTADVVTQLGRALPLTMQQSESTALVLASRVPDTKKAATLQERSARNRVC